MRQDSISGPAEQAGLLIVSLDQEEFNRMLRQEPFETLLPMNEGYVVAAKNPEFVGKTLERLDYGVDLSQQENRQP